MFLDFCIRQYAFIARGGGPRGEGFFVRPPHHAVVTSDDDMLCSRLHVGRHTCSCCRYSSVLYHLDIVQYAESIVAHWLDIQNTSCIHGTNDEDEEKSLCSDIDNVFEWRIISLTADPMNMQWHNTGNMEFREQLQCRNMLQRLVLWVVIVHWLLGNIRPIQKLLEMSVKENRNWWWWQQIIESTLNVIVVLLNVNVYSVGGVCACHVVCHDKWQWI